MKKFFLIFMLSSLIFYTQAQKVKIKEGSLKFLKGQTELNFVFDYEGMLVEGEPEEVYIQKKYKDEEEDSAGAGDKWLTAWQTTDRKNVYEVKLLKYFNMQMGQFHLKGSRNNNEAPYTATIRTIDIETVGDLFTATELTVEIIITERNSSKTLARISISEASGNYFDYAMAIKDNLRIADAYRDVGEQLAGLIIKAIK